MKKSIIASVSMVLLILLISACSSVKAARTRNKEYRITVLHTTITTEGSGRTVMVNMAWQQEKH